MADVLNQRLGRPKPTNKPFTTSNPTISGGTSTFALPDPTYTTLNLDAPAGPTYKSLLTRGASTKKTSSLLSGSTLGNSSFSDFMSTVPAYEPMTRLNVKMKKLDDPSHGTMSSGRRLDGIDNTVEDYLARPSRTLDVYNTTFLEGYTEYDQNTDITDPWSGRTMKGGTVTGPFTTGQKAHGAYIGHDGNVYDVHGNLLTTYGFKQGGKWTFVKQPRSQYT